VEQLKAKIERLANSEQEAKKQQKAAAEEIKKLQKDMEEFKSNKDGKIDELKVHFSSLVRLCPTTLVLGQHFQTKDCSAEALR